MHLEESRLNMAAEQTRPWGEEQEKERHQGIKSAGPMAAYRKERLGKGKLRAGEFSVGVW